MRPEKRPVLFRPRTDPPGGKRWIQHGDLAARCARSDAICVCPRERRGRRESRVPMTPAVVRTRCTRRTAGAPEHPAFPAQWFYGLCRDLPGAEFLWPPSPTDWRSIESPVGPDNLHQLDTSNGCQDHALLPSAASSCHTLQPARMLPEEVSTEAFKRRSSRASSPLSEQPPCEHTSRLTLPRPPQPAPTFVTLANAPLLGTG